MAISNSLRNSLRSAFIKAMPREIKNAYTNPDDMATSKEVLIEIADKWIDYFNLTTKDMAEIVATDDDFWENGEDFQRDHYNI